MDRLGMGPRTSLTHLIRLQWAYLNNPLMAGSMPCLSLQCYQSITKMETRGLEMMVVDGRVGGGVGS